MARFELDFQPCSPPACTALSTASSSTESLAVPLPRNRFLFPRIDAFRRFAVCYPMEPDARNGLSLTCNGCSLSRASISGSKFLACYFASLPACLAARSAVSSTASAGLPQSKAASTLSARCRWTRRLARLLPLPPLPSGTFTSLGIEVFNRFRRLAARLPNPPDCLSLPATASITRVGCGSPFLARYVSGGFAASLVIASCSPLR